MSNQKKYYVRWKEMHEVEIVAENEQAAVDAALKISSRDNRDSADDPIAIAA